MPFEAWPDPVLRGFKNINADIYVPMQGPSELGAPSVGGSEPGASSLAHDSIDTTTPAGRLTFHLFASLRHGGKRRR